MLNRAARFFPILRELRDKLPFGGSLLEVGSGATGLGEFWTKPFVGCDISFSSRPIENMRAVRCSGHLLPFGNAAFDAVVVSDVMEHVRPAQRQQVLTEVLRVARKLVIIGYPCGPAAFDEDQRLYLDYRARNLPPPVWLEEHMHHPFPDEKLFAQLPLGWRIKPISNESLRFHRWMMRTEMSRFCNYALRAALRVMPRSIERSLKYADGDPSYRKIFVLTSELEESRVGE